MIHELSQMGPVVRLNVSRAAEAVIAVFVCTSPEHAQAVEEAVEERARQRSLDFRSAELIELPPAATADPFTPGKPVKVAVFDDAGEQSLEATVVRRISDTHVEVRSRLGRIVPVHERDLRLAS